MTSTLPYTIAPATVEDLRDVVDAFMSMLRELAPLGHDVVPSELNRALYQSGVFKPALESGEHGIVVARGTDIPTLVGVTFFTPTTSIVETRRKQAVAHGIWVHPEWRRQGLALLLQDVAHERLRLAGFEELVSVVVRDNEAGMASARKAGAEVTGYMTTVRLGG